MSPDSRSGQSHERGAPPGPVHDRAMRFVSIAHTLCDVGRPQEAEELCRWVLAQRPNVPVVRAALGRALFESGRLQEARAVLEWVVSVDSAQFVAYRWLAEVLVAMGEWALAFESLQRAQMLSPGDRRIEELLGYARKLSPGDRTPAEGVQIRRTWEGPAFLAEHPPRNVTGRHREGDPGNTPTPSMPAMPPPAQLFELASPWRRALWRARRALEPASRWSHEHPRLTMVLGGAGIFLLLFTSMWFLSSLLEQRRALPARTAVTEADETPLGVDALDFDQLVALTEAALRPPTGQPTAAVTRSLLARAILATEYGRASEKETEELTDTLAGSVSKGARRMELGAAQVLFRVARGDFGGAAETSRELDLAGKELPLLRFVEARRLARAGEPGAALAHLGASGPDGATVLSHTLEAELELDAGRPEKALSLAQDILAKSPHHPGALQMLMEARAALEQDLTAPEAAAVAEGCKASEGRVPTLTAACHLQAALAARRAGKRGEALAEATKAADVMPNDPRLLGLIAQHLANLGANQRATALVDRAVHFADERLSQLAWARAGATLTRTRKVTLPKTPPPGPEARLIAGRASFVAEEPLAEQSQAAAARDPDLAFLRAGDRAVRSHTAEQMRKKLWVQYRNRPPGPVAAYVAGTLAKSEDLDELARVWLGKALYGHGDACRAAHLYSAVLRSLGRSPQASYRLQRALGKLECVRPPRIE
jgi:tetratricopeptide (TPR) repeat protein